MLDQKSAHMDDLIAKYLSNNTSEEETLALEQWVLKSDQNKQHFIEMKKAWILSGIKQTTSSTTTEKAWNNLSKQVFKTQEAKVIPLYKRPLMIAASIALLVVGSWLIFQMISNQSTQPFIAASTNASKPLQLTDGSKIILNHQSKIAYESKDKQRIASLTGDAWFDIARNEKKPFIVKTGQIEVKVLGTAFYVDSRKEMKQTQVIVEEGKVAVTSNGKSVYLEAGDKAVLNKSTGELIKEKNNDINFNSIKTNNLQFENSSLSEVAFALNRSFNIDVTLANQQLAECRLDAVFKQKSIHTIRKVIESTLGVKMTQNGNQWSISGTCK